MSGNWFGETDQVPLAFVFDTYDPSNVSISLGGGLAFSPGVFEIGTGEPLPADVSPASGMVAYSLKRGSTRMGSMLVQMTADERIRVEVFAGGSDPVRAFTDGVRTFVR